MTRSLLVVLSVVPILAAQPRSRQDEAVSLAVAGEYEKALRLFTELLHDAPEDPLLNYYAGAACVRLKRVPEGMGYLERSVRYQARFPQAYSELGELYLQKKVTPEASKVVEKGLKLFPKNTALLELKAKIAAAQ